MFPFTILTSPAQMFPDRKLPLREPLKLPLRSLLRLSACNRPIRGLPANKLPPIEFPVCKPSTCKLVMLRVEGWSLSHCRTPLNETYPKLLQISQFSHIKVISKLHLSITVTVSLSLLLFSVISQVLYNKVLSIFG